MATIGIKGNLLPISEKDYQGNLPNMRYKMCAKCRDAFSGKNTNSQMGWRETQISGYCEKCFDGLFNDD
jgi:hypothetical protein